MSKMRFEPEKNFLSIVTNTLCNVLFGVFSSINESVPAWTLRIERNLTDMGMVKSLIGDVSFIFC